MAISVRKWQAGDITDTIAIFQKSVREVAARDYSPQQIAAWTLVDADALHSRLISSETRVALLGEKMVGFASVEADGHLDLMFTHPDYQQIGVATALLASVEHEVITRGLPVIFTEASISAKPFFIARGFQLLAAQQVEVRGVRFINYRMSKYL